MAHYVDTIRTSLIQYLGGNNHCPLFRHTKEAVLLKTVLLWKPDTTYWNTGYVTFECWVVLYDK